MKSFCFLGIFLIQINTTDRADFHLNSYFSSGSNLWQPRLPVIHKEGIRERDEFLKILFFNVLVPVMFLEKNRKEVCIKTIM